MTRPYRMLCWSLCIVIVCVAMMWHASPGSRENTLHVYCAAGVQRPVDELAREFEARFDIPVTLHFGGSGHLLSAMTLYGTGDVYIAADESYMSIAKDRLLTGRTFRIAEQCPVIAVQRGNPKNIGTVADLLHFNVRLGLANPDAASIGRLTKTLLEESGQWEKVQAHAKVFKPTVSDVANDIRIGAIDAGIVWDATARQYDDIDIVRIARFDARPQHVTAAVLTTTTAPDNARRFCEFLADADSGGPVFSRWYYGGAPHHAETRSP